MATIRYIALLRGINVGGNNIIKMAALRECHEKAGFSNVATYIASGNVLFDSSNGLLKVESIIDAALEKSFGYKGPTVVLSEKDFRTIIHEAPKGFGTQPNTYHSDVIFLKLPSRPDQVLKDMLALKMRDGVDTAAAGSKALYFTRLSALRTKSRLSKIIELSSYKSMTIRNWNTAKKLEALLDAES
jgi:uncharacterized protein (DUF1697 family)